MSSWLAVKARRAEATADAKRLEAEANAYEAKKNSEWAEANAGALGKTAQELEVVNVTKQMRILGLQVDLDIAELRTDPRIGLLRLAHPLKDTWEVKVYGPNYEGEGKARIDNNYPPLLELRRFVTAAVLATGQDYAALVPPITHDGENVLESFLSSKRARLLTRGAGKTARLWDALTGRQIAVLRRADEKVIEVGLSPDGATAFTHSLDGVVRLWETRDGAFRTETEPRRERIKLKVSGPFDPFEETVPWLSAASLVVTQLSNDRLMTSSTELEIWAAPNKENKTGARQLRKGPVELWDATTGRRVARLDTPDSRSEPFQFLSKRWVTAIEGNTLLVFSTEDGRLLARLNHPAGETVSEVALSPSGRKVFTCAFSTARDQHNFFPATGTVRAWDTGSWQAEPGVADIGGGYNTFQFLTDNLVAARLRYDGWGPWSIYRLGQLDRVVELPSDQVDVLENLAPVGELARVNGEVYDGRTWKRLSPPPGRRFHPDLAKFAPDGRFVDAVINGQNGVIDTRVDKVVPVNGVWSNLPGFGLVAAGNGDGPGVKVRLLPLASHLNLPADLLELWAQVAVRGELGEDGQFVKWNEATWEKEAAGTRRQACSLSRLPVSRPRRHGQTALAATGVRERQRRG